MTDAVTLREMTAADLPAVLDLEHALFGDEAWTEGMLASELAGVASGRYYLVAEDGAELAGYAGLLTPGGGQADVLTLAVAAPRQGQGLGAALLDALLAEAGGAAPRCSSRCGSTISGRSCSISGAGSWRSASGAATTSHRAPMPWSCG